MKKGYIKSRLVEFGTARAVSPKRAWPRSLSEKTEGARKCWLAFSAPSSHDASSKHALKTRTVKRSSDTHGRKEDKKGT